MAKTLRIGFMGTPDFALEALKALHATDHEIVCVYSQPPRPKGRGHKMQLSPVHDYAERNLIPVYHPKSLKTEEAQAEFAAHDLDVAVVAAYGLILPKAVLDAPTYGCINIHASLLPRWRGASPIQRAIWEGDAQSGVTIMQMDEGLDTGPEIVKEAIDLDARETAASLHDRLAEMGGRMAVEVIEQLAENGQVTSKQQKNEDATYAHLLKKDDGVVDWNNDAQSIDRQIRALNPWPGVRATIDGKDFKIILSEPADTADTKNQPVGMVLDKHGHIQCGDNTVLQLKMIQPAGKNAMDFASAINGGYIKI
ncbi:MAG: methionyl-tRNA formyltransferase [Alphaproteobacteria bacterium]|nr:methionyl-tRNA formyltransferase [Alphaproteobacteria bacterium]